MNKIMDLRCFWVAALRFLYGPKTIGVSLPS